MTDQEALRLYTRLFTEALGEKPPEGMAYIAQFGCYRYQYPYGRDENGAPIGHSHSEWWPTSRVDWNAIHLLIERSEQNRKDWFIYLDGVGKTYSISIRNGDDYRISAASGSQPADMLEAFMQAAGLKE